MSAPLRSRLASAHSSKEFKESLRTLLIAYTAGKRGEGVDGNIVQHFEFGYA